jgi:hypothetical protein
MLMMRGVSLLVFQCLAVTTVQAFAGWRIALNIGREQGSANSWAASGARLPIVVQCDVNPDQTIVPKENMIRFTGREGEVIKPIQPGTWSLANNRDLAFTLSFPEELLRNDVSIDAGTTLTMEGLVYSKKDLEDINQQFYKARDQEWKAMGEVDDIQRRKDAPKKWNEASGEWEIRYETESISSKFAKQLQLFQTERVRQKEDQNRPRPKDLSTDCGPFPGVDGDVYMAMAGNIKIRSGWRDTVAGTWSAEPILGNPKSYYRN